MNIGKSVRLAQTMRTLRNVLLCVPLLLFLVMVFVFPLAAFTYRAIDNRVLYETFPQTHTELVSWQAEHDVPEAAFAALAADLKAIEAPERVAVAARNLNNFAEGFRSLLMKTANRLPEAPPPSWRDFFFAVDKRWQSANYWGVLKHQTSRFTPSFLLAALDLKIGDSGGIVRVDPDRRLYVPLLLRTFEISLWVAAICLVLGYPTAYVMTRLPPLAAGLAMVCVLLPFWTSLLVRTTAWIIVLQGNGPVNGLLMFLGIIGAPLELIFNRFGTLVAMSHVLLPYMILPLYSVMRLVPDNQVRAAQSLGANARTAFLRVYLPQTASGIAAGLLLVFVLALGYYITPALVGGPRDQMISYMITYQVNEVVNWGMASALGVLLLVSTLLLLLVLSRFIRLKQIVG
ncbi:ABC transporter permease [Aestuariivirga sp.]|uniref:ABC transporter permease n=1 Tax=Aestuariivirga sp. TaxID=2650926 RepID=UPI003918CEF0